jgi:hypothetical protein
VRRPVAGPAVGLDLDQPAPPHAAVHLADEQLADQVLGDLERVAVEEVRTEDIPGGRGKHLCTI